MRRFYPYLTTSYVALVCMALLGGQICAATLDVGPSGYTYTSIQTAIEAAVDGDVIMVHDGTYVEGIDFRGKKITVRSENGPASTIIDCSTLYWTLGVAFWSGEGSDSVLDGLTVTGGLQCGNGGGVVCSASSPTITNCVITGNRGLSNGAGIYAYAGRPVISNCVITNNALVEFDLSGNPTYYSMGAGLYFRNCTAVVTNCLIAGNKACVGGGIAVTSFSLQTNVSFINCTIANNEALIGQSYDDTTNGQGGGFYVEHGPTHTADITLTLTNCIVWGNSAEGGDPEMDFDAATWSPEATYSDVNLSGYGTPAGTADANGNIRLDPLFVCSGGDYHLLAGSPAINAGTSAGAPLTDLDGNPRPCGPAVDMGTYEFHGTQFVRGDANADGTVNIADAVFIVQYLFNKKWGRPPTCFDAADGNDDGRINICDVIAVVLGVSNCHRAIPAPYPTCGPDPTDDLLKCDAYGPCE